MFLEIQHWLAPAIAITFSISWSLPSLFFSRFHFFPLTDMKLLRMMSTVDSV